MKPFPIILTALLITSVGYAKPSSVEFSAVSNHPVLSLPDLESAQAISKTGDTTVSVHIKAASQEKLRSFSASHVGERLAIILNGKMISGPVIRDEMKKDFVVGPLAESDAKALVSAINGQ